MNLFISYRRNDGPGYAGRIFDNLQSDFEIFFDTEDIQIGEEFPKRIKEGIEKAQIVLLILGQNNCDEFKKRLLKIDYVVEELTYAKKLDKVIFPILLGDAKIPNIDCIQNKISFLLKLNTFVINHEKFEQDIISLKTEIKKQILDKKLTHSKQIIRKYSNADNLLASSHIKRKICFSEIGNIKYQFWECGRQINPDFYLVFFPSTKAPKKAFQNFLDKFEEKNIKLPKSLTILTNDESQLYTLNTFTVDGIEKIEVYSYNKFFLADCIPEDIKNYKYDIELDPYYISQDIYDCNNSDEHSIGSSYEVIDNFIKNDSYENIMMLIAQAGTGKTTFIEYLIKQMNDMENYISIYISSDVLKDNPTRYDELSEILTIYDLYESYTRCNKAPYIDENIFNLGLMNGVMIIIIDGLDEIISFYRGKFKLKNFIESLINLNQELGKCKAIITSREYYWKDNDILNKDEIFIYRLKGFDNTLLESYLNRRYQELSNKKIINQHIQKTNKYISEIFTVTNDEKIKPYIVDILCETVEDEFEDNLQEMEIELYYDDYPNNHHIIDRVIYAVFERELTRQSYHMDLTVRDIVNIFISLSLEHGSVFTLHDMKETIGQKYNATYENIILQLKFSPLLIVEQNSIKFKHTFMKNYFISLHMLDEFRNIRSSKHSINILANMHETESEIFEKIVSYFRNEKQELFLEGAKSLFQYILKQYNLNEENQYEQKKIQSAISVMLYLLIEIYGNNLSSDKKMDLIKNLYNCQNTTIRHLFIFGDFYKLDFSNMTIMESIFDNYNNFSTSKFSNTKFLYTEFIDMKNISVKNDVWAKIEIDETCTKNGFMNEKSTEQLRHKTSQILKDILKRIKNNKNMHIQKDRQPDTKYMHCLVEHQLVQEVSEVGNKIYFRFDSNNKRKAIQFLKNGNTKNKIISSILNCLEKTIKRIL